MSKKWLLVFLATALLGGCIKLTAAPSVEGKAYMVAKDVLYYCDATDGNPECWAVQEIE